jgi:glycosyltransferase involved in cell wall biosynthesis
MRKVLINAGNLHVGGGIQAAVSFIIELCRDPAILSECKLHLYVSTAVHSNLIAAGFSAPTHIQYRIIDLYGLRTLWRANLFRGFDLVFTIFGPLYISFRPSKHIVGFAQAWIIYPDNEVSRRLPILKRALLRCIYSLKWMFFARADRLIVEQDHVKRRLSSQRQFPGDRIDVVNNCVGTIYAHSSLWQPIATFPGRVRGVIYLGYLTRAYIHKNLDFLPAVAQELARIARSQYKFVVTLTQAEWETQSLCFRRHVLNVGPLAIPQCPTFYSSIDGAIFPSLLECFSANPIEAMIMRRPLFASDRPFVRDCCKDNALYFDPTDPRGAALRIDAWFARTAPTHRADHVVRAYNFAASLPNSLDRAKNYSEIIRQELYRAEIASAQ